MVQHYDVWGHPVPPPGEHDSFGLPTEVPGGVKPDAASMRRGEVRWGDTMDKDIVVPNGDDTEISIPMEQFLSVNDVPRVWALRVSCTWVNFALNFGGFPLDDATAGFTVTAGVGSGMIPHTYLFGLLALKGFAELFLPALPAQSIQVQASLAFNPENGTERRQSFRFAAAVAPYTRLRHDE